MMINAHSSWPPPWKMPLLNIRPLAPAIMPVDPWPSPDLHLTHAPQALLHAEMLNPDGLGTS